jgi:hypothetical protein
MDTSLRILLDEHRNNAAKQRQLAGVTIDTVKGFVLSEMAIAIAEHDWEAWHTLFGNAGIAREMTYRLAKIDA